MPKPDQRTRTSRRSSMRLRAVCSEWVAIIPMMVKEITSAVTMSFAGGCIGVSPFDEHTISRMNDWGDDRHQAVLWCWSQVYRTTAMTGARGTHPADKPSGSHSLLRPETAASSPTRLQQLDRLKALQCQEPNIPCRHHQQLLRQSQHLLSVELHWNKVTSKAYTDAEIAC